MIKLDMGLDGTPVDIIPEADSAGVPIPYLQSDVNGARNFAQLGTQLCDFTPTYLSADFNPVATFHVADECVLLPYSSAWVCYVDCSSKVESARDGKRCVQSF